MSQNQKDNRSVSLESEAIDGLRLLVLQANVWIHGQTHDSFDYELGSPAS